MRINDELFTIMYQCLDTTKKVTKLSVKEGQFKDMCHTINVINSLPYGKSIMGEYLLDDYEIPEVFAEMIVPCRVKFSSDENSLDFKSSKYLDVDALTGTKNLMPPFEFKMQWMAILGALKISSNAFTNVKALRTDKILTDVSVQMASHVNMQCKDVGLYVPILVTTNFYVDHVYNVSVNDMFKRWFLDLIWNA